MLSDGIKTATGWLLCFFSLLVTMERENAMRHFLFVFLILLASMPGYAAANSPGWKEALSRILGRSAEPKIAVSTTALERSVQTQLYAAQGVNSAANASFWKPSLAGHTDLRLSYQSMAVSSSSNTPPANEEDSRFNNMNDRLAKLWRSVTARDLSLMQKRKTDMLSFLDIRYPTQPINYAALIPPTVKTIQVGEEHGFSSLRRAFETMVFQYQEMYPDRKIIILTEFVFDRTLPLSEKTGEPVSLLSLKYRRVSSDFRFLGRFVKRGIEVVGLEDERYFRSHQKLITPSFRQVESVYGMKQRNDHWRRIIEEVRQREPDAIFFIYTGNMHVHYRAPFSLARASSQIFVIQLLANDLGKDLPFGAVMQQEPFARVSSDAAYPTVLSWKKVSPYRVVSGFDACFIFPTK